MEAHTVIQLTCFVLAAVLWVASIFGPFGAIRAARKPEGAPAWVESRIRDRQRVDVPSSVPAAWASLFAAGGALAYAAGHGWTARPLGIVALVAAAAFVVLAFVLGGPWPTARVRMDAKGIRVGRREVPWSSVRSVRVARFRTGTTRDQTGSSPVFRTRAELATDEGLVQLPYGAFIALDGPAVAAVIGAAQEQFTGERMTVSTAPRQRSTIGGEVRQGSRQGELNTFALIAGGLVVLMFVVGLVGGWLLGERAGAMPIAIALGALGAVACVCGVIGRIQIARYAETGRRLALAGIVVGGLAAAGVGVLLFSF